MESSVRNAKVVLGIPHVGDLKGYFFDTVLSLQGPRASCVRVENKPIDMARNMIVDAFLQTDATHLFFMDSDQMFHPGALLRLLERDKDIVGGTYFARTETPIPHVYDYAADGLDDKGNARRYYRTKATEFVSWWKAHPEAGHQPNAHVYLDSPESLIRADAIATGCMLIKRHVLESLSDPWFKCWPGSAGGEDFDFCEKAIVAGFEVWADFSVQCGHGVQMVFIGAEDFVGTYGIGTPEEYDFVEPVLVEAGPNGRTVKLGATAPSIETEVA